MPKKHEPEEPKSETWVDERQKRRSKRAQTIDSQKDAKETYPRSDPDGRKKWAKHPGRVDLTGVDTKTKYHERQETLKVPERPSFKEKLLKVVGAARWQKEENDRIYFNELGVLYGLKVSCYKTGNISSASLDGERISNSQAGKILGRLNGAKVWWDAADQKFHGRNISQEDFDVIHEAIRTRAARDDPASVERELAERPQKRMLPGYERTFEKKR